MSDTGKKTYSPEEICEMTGLSRPVLHIYVEREWVIPPSQERFDQEDLSRILLIQELKEDFGVNEEAVSLVLHLVDQLYCLRNRVRKAAECRGPGT